MAQSVLSRAVEAWWCRRHPEWTQPVPGEVAPRFELATAALPRYVGDRAVVAARRVVAREPQPWITAAAQRLLEGMLRPTDRGLEYGAGATTLFFARRVEWVDSVEAVERWHESLAGRLREHAVTNVDLHLVSAARLGHRTPQHRDAYVNVRADLAPGSLDFVFVDGEYRDQCALRGVELLRSGGLLVLDNADTYLPHRSRSPWRVAAPASAGWEEFVRATRDWRRIWTTNGVWDTAIWIKP